MSKEVSGKLSSRVMNMKFMKQADHVEELAKEEQKEKQFVDSSEWKLNGGDALKQKLRPQLRTAGVTEIMQQSQAVLTTGRRTFGEPKKEETSPEDASLDELWQKQKQVRAQGNFEKSGQEGSEKDEDDKDSEDIKNNDNIAQKPVKRPVVDVDEKPIKRRKRTKRKN